MKQKIIFLFGFLLLGLAFIGIFVPFLPTTPFVLLAAGCFSSYPKIFGWLCKSKLFSEYIENYQTGAGISKITRRNSLLFLWITLSISALLFHRPLVWTILLLVGIAVSIHILTIAKKPNQILVIHKEKK